MFIEKNHNHIFNSNVNSSAKKNTYAKQFENLEKSGFNFWKWIKGAVHPLQNLPIISGIYSSFNSENEESDRDMIQSSGGGFLYGGPIGAIAGFGTWVFRKIFDKTPTELALDMMGISRIWKSENISTAKVEKKNSNKNQSNEFDGKNKVERLNNKVTMNLDQQSSAKINNISKEDDVIFPRRTKGFEIQYPKWQPNFMDKKPFKINKKMQLMYDSNRNTQDDIKSRLSLKA